MFLNLHQLQGSYIAVGVGFKYNRRNLQAAIGIHQLKRVTPYWQRREQIWQRYNEAFADLPITLPANPEPDTIHAYHLYTILVDEAKAGISRDEFLNAINAENIGVGVHYMSVPEHPKKKSIKKCLDGGRKTIRMLRTSGGIQLACRFRQN